MPGCLRSLSRLLACASLSLFALAAHLPAWSDEVTLAPSKDNTIYQGADNQNLSNGAGEYLFAGMTGGGLKRRALLRFDLSGIPAGATIQSATLTLNMSRTNSGALPITLHRLTADWGEGASNAFGQEGRGANSQTNDASWLRRFFNTVSWTTQGGDFAATASATQTVTDLGFYSWDSTGMAADVQRWVNTPGENFGWIILGVESEATTAKRFDSRENATAANRPKLRVVYTPPSANATLSGTLTRTGIAENAPAETVTFLFRPSDMSGDLTRTVAVGASGVFQIPDLPRKNYQAHITGAKYLATNATADLSAGDVTNFSAALRTGDIVDDEVVDLFDLVELFNHFGASNGDPDYDALSDLTGDGEIDLFDLVQLFNYYGEEGDP